MKIIINPEYDYKSQGLEDAQINKIDDTYYLTYTEYDGIKAHSALATSKDLKNFTRHRIIVPPITYAEFVFGADTAGKIIEH